MEAAEERRGKRGMEPGEAAGAEQRKGRNRVKVEGEIELVLSAADIKKT